ncbi:ATP phosphoribosyltransferase [Engelhardtia mirabilis]|uniref:ATP phosphoribosyltransferase n=1 Tax=Engelhardtia mirabilis TaxID=2528011 RepID=A0A518BI32_9BACT|nr:ATP phosphoribosyltransferase [Planctomycetes bacterium Pla133]QDV00952.1 ATP phosphoribosyltransferase [Planctomycetes bacterium Pla86]
MNPAPRRADDDLRLALPKGRMQEGIWRLLAEGSLPVRASSRNYRPTVGPGFEVKVLKPRTVVEMLHSGTRDVGFAGADWVAELDADVVELLDTGLDPVRLVAAAPAELLEDGALPRRPLVVASEFERLTANWIEGRRLDATFVRSNGATEVFPPEDADLICDITQTGATLRANGLVVLDTLVESSTRLYASRAVLDDEGRAARVRDLALVIGSVIEARGRVMLEVNVPVDRLDAVVEVLPCMRQPTIAELFGGSGYAVKAAVPRSALPRLIPARKARGGSDVVVSALSQIVA